MQALAKQPCDVSTSDGGVLDFDAHISEAGERALVHADGERQALGIVADDVDRPFGSIKTRHDSVEVDQRHLLLHRQSQPDVLVVRWVRTAISVAQQAIISERVWPSFRGPTHDGKSAEAITWPKDGPKQLWKINVGIGHSAVSVVGDRAYTMGNANDTDTVFSIDVATGKVVWTHSYPCNEKVGIKDYDGPFATPTVANGVVYTLSRKGDVFALNAKDGKVIWARNIVQEDGVRPPGFGGLAGSPLVLGDKLILNGSSGGMALDARTGKTLWKSGMGAGGHASPVPMQIGEKTLPGHPLSESLDHRRRGRWQGSLDHAAAPAHRGQRTRTRWWMARRCSSPRDGRFGGALFDVTGATTPLWEQEGLSSHWHTSVLVNGFLFGPDGNNSEGAGRSPTSLRCLDWKTGEIKWTEPKLGFNGLIAVGGKLLVLTEMGDLVLVEASPRRLHGTGLGTGHRRMSVHRPCAWPTERRMSRNVKGDVVCVDLRGK